MTRRGSLAYYLAAVVCGSFFLAVSYHGSFLASGAAREHWARDFLFVYFFTVSLGFIPQLLAAFSLRRLASRLGWTRAWQWVAAGSVLFLVVLWGLGKLGLAVEDAYFAQGFQKLKAALMFLLVGPMMATTKPMWLPVPAAAATSWVLYLVHRAFAPRPEP